MLEPWAMSYKQRKKRIYYKLFEQHLIQKASAVQTLSSVELQNLNSLQIQNTVLVPNGIQVQEFAKLPNSEIFYQDFPETKDKTLILFLGRIDPKKGLNVLAPAFAKVREKFPETHLVIAGPDNIGFLPQVQSYFQQVACLEAVTFTGMLRGNLKYAALAAADLYVAPSYSEGFSMSILEAMASSLPCVITTGCNFPEAASRRAALVVDLSVHNIQNALIYLLQNPDEAKAMGDRARDLIFHNYTWNQSAQKLAQVYQSIIDKRHLPN
jgi:glycosyltransferase involved in cell wall biosynthesis